MANDKLAKVGETGLSAIFGEVTDLSQRPDFIPEGDTSGTEGISKDDLRMNRLGIAQGLSPQMIPTNADYIKGLAMGEMFNDRTKVNYGNGPLYFIAVRRDVRCIQFKPREEGGGIVDMNAPRELAEKWVDGKPPVATLFNEYVALLLKADGQDPEPIVISVKNTNKWNRRAYTDLNGFIKMHASQGAKSVPIYGVIYAIESRLQTDDDNTYGVPMFKQIGYIPKNEMGTNLYATAKSFAESLMDKTIVIDRQPGDESFNPEAIEGQVVDDGR